MSQSERLKRFYDEQRHLDHVSAQRRGEVYDALAPLVAELVKKHGAKNVAFILGVLKNDVEDGT